MGNRASKPVELPNAHNLEPAFVSIRDETVQFGPRICCPRNSYIDIFIRNNPAATFAKFAQLPELHFRTLSVSNGAHPRVNSDSHLLASLSVTRVLLWRTPAELPVCP